MTTAEMLDELRTRHHDFRLKANRWGWWLRMRIEDDSRGQPQYIKYHGRRLDQVVASAYYEAPQNSYALGLMHAIDEAWNATTEVWVCTCNYEFDPQELLDAAPLGMPTIPPPET